MPSAINVSDLSEMRGSATPHALLDVREDWERDIARLPNTIDIAMGQIPDRVNELPRDMPLVVMCHHGGRSMQVVQWLQANGFSNAVNLTGGIHAWAERIDSSVATY